MTEIETARATIHRAQREIMEAYMVIGEEWPIDVRCCVRTARAYLQSLVNRGAWEAVNDVIEIVPEDKRWKSE